MANQVALTSDGVLFLGLPRYASDNPTPSIARRAVDGTLLPFPGNAWNDWRPGNDGRDAFVYLNSVHIFSDDTVWCVDQGTLSPGIFPGVNASLHPDAQKLVQLDARTGAVLQVLRFDRDVLPPGAQMNDLRFHGQMLYISDSGLGGIIVRNMSTGTTTRRLSGNAVVMASTTAKIPAVLAHVKGGKTFTPPNSDLIEITADGKWLYWAAPTGPLYRVETRYLNDMSLSDDELAQHVEHVFDNAFAGGCAMDSRGNVYFSETVTNHITVVAPSGRTETLVADPRLIRPDGTFISHDRVLYIPVKQPSVSGAGDSPYVTYSIALPRMLGDIELGDAVSGA
ncbi:L-dopachrome tautomerase-related protein [Paraburkholderia tropica]|uniref:Major royal jelly protein n=1 Tax=Paraburkholderia tropica TaxID=92647 RepID=A0AAQ1GDC4_9BURK|nr:MULTISPECIES: L-dopachrome tautomerase-related protein [Paraburkholderia]SEJ32286.1 Major royal jelly protein [Paraburkholderia tropica]